MELPLQRFVIVDFVKEIGIKVGPFLKCIFFAEQARSHIVGNKGCFDKQCATATHRVDEIGLAMPSRHQYHARCQHFVQGGFH